MNGLSRTIRNGAAAGLIAASLITFAMFVGRIKWGAPLIPEIMAEKLFANISMELFAFTVSIFGKASKYVAFGLLVAVHLVVGAGWGALYAYLRSTMFGRLPRHASGLCYGAGLWILTIFIFFPAMSTGRGGIAQSALRPFPAISMLFYLLSYGLMLSYLLGPLKITIMKKPELNEQQPYQKANGRRLFLARGWSIFLTLAVASSLAGFARLVMKAASAVAADLFAMIKGLSKEVTPNDQFYEVSKNVFNPAVDAKKWSLEIKGLVGSPRKFTLDELRRMPSMEQYATLECISNTVGGDQIGNALWKGVRLRALLELARPLDKAIEIILRAADGYSDSFPLAKGREPGVILAYEMNGQELPGGHGSPARLIVPGIYGMKNVKWVTEIELSDSDHLGYWQTRGWSDVARIKTRSRIDTPNHAEKLDPGPLGIGGIAFAGDRGVRGVEVSFDDGASWREAIIKKALSPYSWVLWAYEWKPSKEDLAKKNIIIKVRATDGSGQVQTAQATPPEPDGASGLHAIRVMFK